MITPFLKYIFVYAKHSLINQTLNRELFSKFKFKEWKIFFLKNKLKKKIFILLFISLQFHLVIVNHHSGYMTFLEYCVIFSPQFILSLHVTDTKTSYQVLTFLCARQTPRRSHQQWWSTQSYQSCPTIIHLKIWVFIFQMMVGRSWHFMLS